MFSLSVLPSPLPQRCFTLMDRGFTFKLISNYVNMITATDNKVTPAHRSKRQGNTHTHTHTHLDSDVKPKSEAYLKCCCCCSAGAV